MYIVINAENAAVGSKPYMTIIDMLCFLIFNIHFSPHLSLAHKRVLQFSEINFSKSSAVRYNAAKEKGINIVIIILLYGTIFRELI